MTINNSNLFYLCSLVEYIARKQKLERKDVINILGKDNINRIYTSADILHSEPIEKISDEYIIYANIPSGNYDNVSACNYAVPDFWTIGKVYERLIEDTFDDSTALSEHISAVYNSWVSEGICNYNSDFYYQPRKYIALCYLENKLIA